MTPELAALGYDETARIRFLNDRLRTTGLGGKMFITRGITALSDRSFGSLSRFRQFTI